MGHAGSDVEVGYRNIKEIEKDEANDPLIHSARIMIENNCLTNEVPLVLEFSRFYIYMPTNDLRFKNRDQISFSNIILR